MTLRDTPQPGAASCPKRLWVMSTLADDEALEGGEALPQGLKFHLSRCEPCRLLADQLQSVTGSLGSLAALDPSESLAERADTQMRTALRSGVSPTGRVAIPDASLPSKPRPKSGLVRIFRYATAAVVLIAVGLLGVALLQKGSGPSLADKGNQSPRVTPGRGGDAATTRLASRGHPKSPKESRESSPASAVEQDGDVTGGTQRVAAGLSDGPSLRQRPQCRYYSHVEAAECDGVECVPTAIVVPRPGDRDLGWGQGLFDNSRTAVSTRPLRSKNKRRNQD